MLEPQMPTDDTPPNQLERSSSDSTATPESNQLDTGNDLSTTLDKLQITERIIQSNTIPSQDYDSDEYEAIQYESDESWDNGYRVHGMSKRDIRLYDERWVLERQEPIQAHLEALHQAFWNVDPDYTVFAFGGTIPKEEISCEELVLRVWKDANVKEVVEKEATDKRGDSDDEGIQEASIKNCKGKGAGSRDGQE
jgi:hypothetical protein